MNIHQCLVAICGEFEGAIREFDTRNDGGMRVPFHGDFASAVQLPSVIGKMRWWVREMKTALETGWDGRVLCCVCGASVPESQRATVNPRCERCGK